MAAIPTFPLLGLPYDEIRRTIRVMDLKQILKFSTISERCKNLVTSFKIKGTSINVYVQNDIHISIETVSSQITLFYYTERNKYWGVGAYGRKKRLTPPLSVFIDEPSKWKKRDFTMKAWLEHLQNVFNYHKIDSISFYHLSFQFDMDDIKEVFGNVTKITIVDTGRFAFNQLILQEFFPIEDLTIMAETFRNSKIPPSLLMQNHATLKIWESDSEESTNITLDDLLLINSKVIIVQNPLMPQKLLNNFIKLWQKGSNPHMEYLCVDDFDIVENDKEIIMKGIKHEVNPLDRVRKFKSVESFCSGPAYGGMDFYRMDGVKATILFKRHIFPAVEMLVWFDHCVVE